MWNNALRHRLMTQDGEQPNVPLFAPDYRASGILLHITSLPSPYGIGDIGPSAFSWIDRLHEGGQRWWEALPLGPTGYGNSPYQSLSSFAGNDLLVSPTGLTADGLLQPGDCAAGFAPGVVDYDAVIPFKRRLLEKAWRCFKAGARRDVRAPFDEYCAAQATWLDDYALFRALKARFNGAYYLEWPPELVGRRADALIEARRELADEIDQVRFGQFLLRRQADQLQKYGRTKGIRLIGDLPFFVSPDSSDVWANPELFLLDEQRRPRFVAGVPPDYFCAQGQLWGNPVYNWDALRATGYRWCIDRLRVLLSHVDVIRLDHFRGFAAAWHVPAGAPTAQSGEWSPGPGAAFFKAASKELGHLPLIAEDLGLITPDVDALRDQFRIPGTRVLQFAFDGDRHNPHLPDHFVANAVAYTGTHDNATTREWFEDLNAGQRQVLSNYLQRSSIGSAEAAPELMRLAWSSAAALAIAPLQDLLNLGREARMNVPGRADGNWRWRATESMLSSPVYQWLRDLTEKSRRSGSSRDAAVPVSPALQSGTL
ncbi:MAG TPA: 4-alpha-glucanotransferase [Casimicrobiaceae bacterium]|nr:4-alpha-glucanotransferase [Casimicrobiaceae bacterium]